MLWFLEDVLTAWFIEIWCWLFDHIMFVKIMSVPGWAPTPYDLWWQNMIQLTFSERSSAPSAHSLVLRPKLIVTGAATYPLGTRSKSIHSKHIMYISYSVVALTYGITNSSVWGSQTPSVQAQRLGFSSFHSWQMQRDSAVTPTVSIKQTLAQLPCLVK